MTSGQETAGEEIGQEFAEEAMGHLRSLTGDPASGFREQQLEAIHQAVERRERVFLVQRTGWGKSAVYFIATRMLRDRGAGPTLLVSPLLALMRNQIDAAARMGIRAVSINSGNEADWGRIQGELDADRVDVLLVAPERLANEAFRRDVLPQLGRRVGLLVVDEAHCISDWGHDFRPDYRRIVRATDLMPTGVPIVACTATANDRVVHDVDEQLRTDATIRGPLRRQGLALHVLDLPRREDRLAWLAEAIPGLGGSGIVYTLTVRDAELVADWLRARGIDAVAYHARLELGQKEAVERRLLDNDVDVVVATVALGMGFDKPDLHFVIHYQAPSSIIAYYQQVGRAGRQIERSVGVLLRGAEDAQIQDSFIRTAFPDPDLTSAIVADLEENPSGFRKRDLEQRHNVRPMRLSHLLTTLHVEGAVEKDGPYWRRSLSPWSYDRQRAEEVTARRRLEQEEMLGYAAAQGCRMAFLCRSLDDVDIEPCGICDRCTEASLTLQLPDDLAVAAVSHLRRGDAVIGTRRQWPTGSRIESTLRIEEGRALSLWGDGGWGDRVSRDRAAGRFGDDLVSAAVELINGRWGPDPRPTWVTVVPSIRYSGTTEDFATRLADSLGLRFMNVVERIEAREPQRTMENSHQQWANVDGAFRIDGEVDQGPVLLVDDVVDSRWTITVAGAQLRAAGSGPVFPFVLSSATPGGS